MSSHEYIQNLLADLESDRVERTVAVDNTDKFCRAICAFANDLPNHQAPGYLIIGANDAGKVAGTPITDQLLQNLAAHRANGNILPPPALLVYKVELPEGAVAVVEVQPSLLPPVYYNGRICVRIGPRRGFANPDEERRLSERRSVLVATYDIHPIPESSLSDISRRIFDEYRIAALPPDVIEANHRTLQESLAALRFFDLTRGLITVAGVLLFGTNARYFLPGAYIQFLKFPGESIEDTPEDQLEISGDLASIIRIVHDKIHSYNRTQMRQGDSLTDQLLPDYPTWALREIFHNALIHRDYAATTPIRFYWFCDRIEVQNPGGLHGHLNINNFRSTNSYRNPVIAEACKVLGFVNKFGHGIARAERLLRENGNPPLSLLPEQGFFQAIIYRRAP